jgi:hypothetical protein
VEVEEMSSVGSYDDTDNNEGNSDNKGGNNNRGNGANEGNASSRNSEPSVSNTNNREIYSALGPLDFIIEKQNCISIYDIDILDIDDFF